MSIIKLAAAPEPIKASHKGRLHEYLSISEGEKIPESLLHEKMRTEKDPARRKELNYAIVARHWHHKGH
jgi:hypothetical protein